MLRDVTGALSHPEQRLSQIAAGRRSPARAGAVVVACGLAALGLSLLSTLAEPERADTNRAAGVGFSLALPFLFVAVWVADAWIIDGVARLMACPGRRRTYLVTSAFAVPVLVVFEVVRVIQALIDRGGSDTADATATAVGFIDFAVLAWFVVLLAIAVRAVYGLPAMSAVAAALAPSAVMATLLVLFLVVASALHGAGVI
jgi:hypothetical protein